ncbi:hypothetical protein BN903_11 [Halorubrum sp. AJ67]|nr:hypothetical protein BN903_11 [Halorubrum sp. AJ67]
MCERGLPARPSDAAGAGLVAFAGVGISVVAVPSALSSKLLRSPRSARGIYITI